MKTALFPSALASTTRGGIAEDLMTVLFPPSATSRYGREAAFRCTTLVSQKPQASNCIDRVDGSPMRRGVISAKNWATFI
ncbi:uncharacterized protein FFB14_15256 [Fusarium fujikuroi]|nr:uncharacterized protein FFB14_15256 [Fusarium fujikuroi]